MDDLMENIQKVMSDPESMKQLSQLAQMMGLPSDFESPPPEKKSPPQMDFSQLFSQNVASDNKKSSGDFDFTKLVEISKIIEKSGESNKNIELISALKPHLKPETQAKADRGMKSFRLMALYPLLKESGIIGGDFSDII